MRFSPEIKRFAAVMALAMASTSARAAFADEAEPSVEQIKAAESEFAKGRDAYKNGSYAEAAEHFESADLAAPNPKVLELAIMARDKAGQTDRAATDLQLGLERAPDAENLKALADKILPKAKADFLQIQIECDEPCTLLDGSRLVHGAPATTRTVFVAAGSHTIRAGWSHDRSEAKQVAGDAGGTTTLTFKAPPIPVEAPTAKPAAQGATAAPERERRAEKPSGMSPVVFWIGAGLTVAAAGVATWSGIDTVNNPGKDKVRNHCDPQSADFVSVDDCNKLYDEGNSKELRTNILLGATGVLALGTVIVGAFLTNWSGEPTEDVSADKASIEPWLTVGNGATIGASGRF